MSYFCDICVKGYKSKYTLYQHRKQFHLSKHKIKTVTHTCIKCERVFNRKCNMIIHQKKCLCDKNKNKNVQEQKQENNNMITKKN